MGSAGDSYEIKDFLPIDVVVDQIPSVDSIKAVQFKLAFDTSLVEDFFYAFVQNGGLDLHVELRYGKGPHHALEAIFKGTARALRTALERDPRTKGLPTVKGAL